MPPLTGKPRPSAGGQVRGAERENLLVRVEPLAVLLREHPPDGRCLDGPEHEAGEGHRQQRVDVGAADGGQAQRRQALRDLRPAARRRERRGPEPRGENAGDHHEEGHRPVLQPEFACDEHGKRRHPDQQRRGMRVAQMPEEIARALPEVAVRALEAEQLGQLRAGQVQRQAGLETDQDGLREEARRRFRHEPARPRTQSRRPGAPRTPPTPRAAPDRRRSARRPTRRSAATAPT